MNNTTKITDRAIYEAIANEAWNSIEAETLKTWAEKKIAQLDHKAAKARETAAAKRAAGDELTDEILNVVSNEFRSIADITAEVIENAAPVDREDITVSKIAYRLNAAAKAGTLEKGEIVIELEGKKKKVVGYKRA